MTTHDQHADVHATEGQYPAAEEQYAPRETDIADVRENDIPPPPQEQAARHETRTDETLFADDELAGLRARWNTVQAGFVDDPEDCVQKADGLVADLVQQLTTGFGQARSRLEEQWARGEQASTEDLRIALKQYRSFFDRLLSV